MTLAAIGGLVRPLPSNDVDKIVPVLAPSAEEYAISFIGAVLGRPLASADVDSNLRFAVWHALSRQEEIEQPGRDQWGNWDWQYSAAHRRGELFVPWLDRRLVALKATLAERHPDWNWAPAWPDDRPFAVCLSHDVDLVSRYGSARSLMRLGRYLPRMGGSLTRRALKGLKAMANWMLGQCRPGDDPLWHFGDWQELEARHGMRSSFLFLPYASRPHTCDSTYSFDDPIRFHGRRQRVADMMRSLDHDGWDVGLHGSYHSATSPGLLVEQKRQIEGVIGHPVISTRQHWLHCDVRCTHDLQAEAGLHADSTQGFNRSIGFRAGTSFPYRCWSHKLSSPLSLWEIPQHIMDGALFTANALEYDAEHALRHCVELMDEVERVGGCLTLSWHPHVLNDETWFSVYADLLAEAASRRAWGCSISQLHAWWKTRERFAQSTI